MVVSLVELVSDLPDVSRYHDKVPVGEADQYVPVAVPSTNTEREKQTLVKCQAATTVEMCLMVSDGADYQR